MGSVADRRAAERARAAIALERRQAARAEVARLRARGYGIRQTARHLEASGTPTPSGRGQWWPATVERLEAPDQWAAYIAARRRASPR